MNLRLRNVNAFSKEVLAIAIGSTQFCTHSCRPPSRDFTFSRSRLLHVEQEQRWFHSLIQYCLISTNLQYGYSAQKHGKSWVLSPFNKCSIIEIWSKHAEQKFNNKRKLEFCLSIWNYCTTMTCLFAICRPIVHVLLFNIILNIFSPKCVILEMTTTS